ncbi:MULTISPECIES: hypothetical protein [Vibrio]|uniref:Uncharacterized protein n=1 Tax=Vibrio campbellii TaxID=680 RepID=A0AAQ3B381_9VIBR|nr:MULTISPECIES: hypothetical protein [Vibrio]EDL71020.1 hypothetical protein A1Q_1840 [Vibrio campbellii HY01]APX09328.1 hypothetical protein BWP24_24570 [Vibrio campbellii]ARR08359.1 hypothetical protein Vc3S01_A0386 [Vibrio campbellii]ARR46746.1 hypothetical protein CAY59_21120 [Vibrio campbellii]AUW05635.1 hypothetical protein C1N51_18280 [Vibrio campbellii]
MNSVERSEFNYIKQRINEMKPDQLNEIKGVIEFKRKSLLDDKPLISDEEMEFITIMFKKME